MDNALTSRHRELWIDVLRGIGIIIVILGHTSPPFNKFIYGFHMPLFFILSGYLWKPKEKRLIVDGLRRYIIPYFTLCGINLLIEITKGAFSNDSISLGKYVIGIFYSRGTTEWMPNCSPLWFLTAIFIALFLYEIIHKINNYIIQALVILLLGLCSALLSYFDIFKLLFNIDTAMMGTVFILTGSVLRKYDILGKIKRYTLPKKVLVFVIISTFGVFGICYNPIDMVNFDNNRYGDVLLMLIGAVSISLVLIFLCYVIKWKGLIANGLSWFGRHTIFIMGFDYFSGGVASKILTKTRLQNWASMFAMKILILLVGCLIWTAIVRKIKWVSVRKMLSF